MPIQSLKDLYLDNLRDLYSAERQIIDALPRMIERTSHDKLREAFSDHLAQSREHMRRLEVIAADLGVQLSGKTCRGIQGVLAEGEELMREDVGAGVLDAALISAAQRVEHYEMAAYGCARSYASALDRGEDAAALQDTLDEEGDADHKLTQIAVTVVNRDAGKSINVERELGPGARRADELRTPPKPESRF